MHQKIFYARTYVSIKLCLDLSQYEWKRSEIRMPELLNQCIMKYITIVTVRNASLRHMSARMWGRDPKSEARTQWIMHQKIFYAGFYVIIKLCLNLSPYEWKRSEIRMQNSSINASWNTSKLLLWEIQALHTCQPVCEEGIRNQKPEPNEDCTKRYFTLGFML